MYTVKINAPSHNWSYERQINRSEAAARRMFEAGVRVQCLKPFRAELLDSDGNVIALVEK